MLSLSRAIDIDEEGFRYRGAEVVRAIWGGRYGAQEITRSKLYCAFTKVWRQSLVFRASFFLLIDSISIDTRLRVKKARAGQNVNQEVDVVRINQQSINKHSNESKNASHWHV